MPFKLIDLSLLMYELQDNASLEQNLQSILRGIDVEISYQSLGVFLLEDEHYKLVLSKNLSHAYTENAYLTDEEPIWDSLDGHRFKILDKPDEFKFERDFSQLFVQQLYYRTKCYGLMFIDKAKGEFTEQEIASLKVLGSLISFAIETSQLKKQVDNLVEHDSLTGLLNWKGFCKRLRLQFTQAKRYGRPLTLVSLKLNGLDIVNSQKGEQKVKALMIFIAEKLKLNLRNTEVLGRLNTSTFAVLLPETNHHNTMVAVLRLNNAISRLKDIANLSISWGIVPFSQSINTTEDYMQIAEKTAEEAYKNHESNILINEL